MSLLSAAILGIVEGITEFLPISSTGHLILAARLLNITGTDAVKSFEIAIQLGATLAAVIFYWKLLFTDRRILCKVLVAFLPTGVIGLLLHGIVKRWLLGNDTVVVWSLLLGGLALILFEYFHGERNDAADIGRLTYAQALLLGLCQALAIIPGVSRSAATVIGGLAIGLKRRAAVDFSFLLAIPTMVAATALDIAKSASSFSGSDMAALAVGFAASFFVALAAIAWLLQFVRNHSFAPFGVYRIIAALAFMLFVLR